MADGVRLRAYAAGAWFSSGRQTASPPTSTLSGQNGAVEGFPGLGYRGQLAALRRLADQALVPYPVDVARLTLLSDLENTTFRVDDREGDRYVLRIHRVTGSPFHPVHSPDEIRSELRWLLALDADLESDAAADHGIRVPVPVATRSGELVTVVEAPPPMAPRPCVLLRWVPGRFFDAGLTAAHLWRVGRFMAHLHRHARSFVPPAGFVRPVVGDVTGDVPEYLTTTVADLCGAAAAQIVAEAVDRIEAVIQALGTQSDAFGLVHADLHQENVLFRRGAVAAIDFDDCGWGHYASDFAVMLSELGGRKDFESLQDALLNGYANVADLPPGTDKQHLSAFAARRELQLTLWFLEQRDHPAFADWQQQAHAGLTWLRDHLTAPDR